MKSKILVVENSEAILSKFRGLVPPELDIIEAHHDKDLMGLSVDLASVIGAFVGISTLSHDQALLTDKLYPLAKLIPPSARLYGHSYSADSIPLLTKWGFKLLRPMVRDLKEDIESAFGELLMLNSRVSECQSVQSDCSACRYNDCNGVVKGSELHWTQKPPFSA